MLPYLLKFDWGGIYFRLPAYGVFLAISFASGYLLALHYAKRSNANPQDCENLFLLSIFGSVLGSRLFHVVFEEPHYYWKHPEKIPAIWEGGYTFYGALILGTSLLIWYSKKRKLQFLIYGDLGALALMLGLFTGRIGCFLAGCCWGLPTHLPWGVVYKHPDSFAPLTQVPLHPTQLYEAFGALLLLFYLLWLFERRKYVGQLFFQALMSYALLRFLIEFFRGDDERGHVGFLSYSQIISLIIFPVSWMVSRRFSHQPKAARKA